MAHRAHKSASLLMYIEITSYTQDRKLKCVNALRSASRFIFDAMEQQRVPHFGAELNAVYGWVLCRRNGSQFSSRRGHRVGNVVCGKVFAHEVHVWRGFRKRDDTKGG